MHGHPQSPGPAWEIPVTGKATAIGSISIGLWGALALFTTQTGGQIPPFQLMALTFLIAWGLMQLNWWRQGKSGLSFMRQPPKAWLLGVGGLFLYHFCYFAAMERAPAADVSLIAYLWPLLIVIFSSFLPGGKLLPRHLGGAVIALIGCYFLIAGGGDSSAGYQSAYAGGYLLAGLCALIWSGYSVLNRRYADVPTDAVGWFCLAVSGLAWIAHLSLETSVWPSELGVWVGVIGLGLGPVGLAFFTWDYGVKHGNLPLLGVLSYLTPMISVILLVVFGFTQPTGSLALAGGLIVIASLFAAKGWPRRAA